MQNGFSGFQNDNVKILSAALKTHFTSSEDVVLGVILLPAFVCFVVCRLATIILSRMAMAIMGSLGQRSRSSKVIKKHTFWAISLERIDIERSKWFHFAPSPGGH